MNIGDIDETTYDLSIKNPNTPEAAPLRDPADIIADIQALDKESADILKSIQRIT